MFLLVRISENMDACSETSRIIDILFLFCWKYSLHSCLGALFISAKWGNLFNTYTEFGFLPERLIRNESSVA